MSEQKLLEKDYSWEELSDLERDVSEAIEYSDPKIPGEFKGIIRVVITYKE